MLVAIAPLLLLVPTIPADDGDLPTPSALFDRYRANFDAFSTLKVRWKRVQSHTAAAVASEEAQIVALQSRIAEMDPDAPKYHELNQQLNARRTIRGGMGVPRPLFQTFLTDRKRFMLRSAPAGWEVGHPGDDWKLPDVPVTEASMTRDYQGFELVSFDGDPAHGYRWITPFAGGASAMIRARLYQDDRNELPPLAVNRLLEGRPRHPLDEFFNNDPKTFRAVRREAIDGRPAVLIEQALDGSLRSLGTGRPQPGGAGKGFEQLGVTRAWIDPERGGLPLRIEWSQELRKDGQLQPGTGKPYKVLEVTEILSVGGAFYPTRGMIRTYGLAPAEAAKNAAGKPYDASALVPYEETTWHAARVEANVPLGESFALPFPKGSYYYDEIHGYSMRAGEEGQDHSRLPWALCGALAGGWIVYAFYAGTRALVGRRRAAATA